MDLFAQASPDLLRACAWVFLFGWLVSSRHLPLRLSAGIAVLKIGIPFVYFATNPSGWFHLADDVTYFHGSILFLKTGFEPLSLFSDYRAFPLMAEIAGTRQHIAYPLWNLAGTHLFGPHYFSPVLMNVGATFVSGWFFFRILRAAEFPVLYCRLALAFFLLHWDTLAWSSFLNLKDTLVVTLTLALLHQCMETFKRPRAWRVIPIGLLAFAGVFLRFYAPLFVLLAAGIHLALQKRSWSLAGCLLAAAGVLVAVTGRVASVAGRIHPAEIFWGLPQFLLTPLPWNLSAGYEFLLIPSLLHLLFIVPVLIVLPRLWKQSPPARILLTYLFLVVLAFSMVPENRGIRQRQMAGFVFIWMQFHVLWRLARYAFREESPRREAQ
jgi:hypothetical protein